MTAITQKTFSLTDGRADVKAVHGLFTDTVEVKFDEDGPKTALTITEAESLINLLRQAVAQAREFERSALDESQDRIKNREGDQQGTEDHQGDVA